MSEKTKENIKKFGYYSLNTAFQGIISGIIITVIFSLISDNQILSFTSLLLVLLITVSSVLTGVFNFLSYAKPFHEIQLFVKKVSQGDLTYSANEDNLGPLKSIKAPLEYMRIGLQTLLKEVQETGKIVKDYSTNLEAKIYSTNDHLTMISNELQDIKDTIDIQLISTREVSVTMEEMSAGIGKTAETSSIANESSNRAFQLASTGKNKVNTAAEQMGSIHTSFSDLHTVIKELISGTGKISDMIAEISHIAGQTNLLSLNANIEAARAGEHGKGFSVVAQEVGKLANQTNISAASITSIIDDIQEKADKALNAMTITNNDVDSGLHSINELMNSFNNILASVEAVNSQITDITSVGQQMAAGSEVVTASVGGLSSQFTTVSSKLIEFTREIGNQVEEMETLKHAATELNDKSAKLEELLRKFQIGTV
ncbi:methyl-accepting chemotaxis protein [Metabacillus malikii]|uniref:Methyl-accepting chemotaxis protein n=1 Tax=Metabacillus malikii TaxID=1504265 RepID=A0ABT9ZBC5_9BACI|nr:methyl-accepting chemotaxis protein [Metabacillus malikii]MDQ0229561.1 methyl-accepting chemotaxis protein [Metabacillus malikii]